MSTVKRKWSEAQKLQIIQEAEQNGVTETMRKYNLVHSLYSPSGARLTTVRACKAFNPVTRPLIRLYGSWK